VKKISAGHGSGGKLMNDMIDKVIRKELGDESIQLDDSAILDITGNKIAFTTDTFTISPIFFPGGNIGSLAVNGTVNDIAVMGAEPAYISCALILEEGFDFNEFETILKTMRTEADHAGVKVVTGDTKVVPRGKADKIYINTTGIGLVKNRIARQKIEPGDKIIISGTIGDHGITIMAGRNNLPFSSNLISDCAHLNILIKEIMNDFPESIKFMRDPTRGGVASVLNEIVQGKDISAKLFEDRIPVKNEVNGICNILGLDPLYVANEGKVLIIAGNEDAEAIVRKLKTNELGNNAAIIGEISSEYKGKAFLETEIGGKRILPLLIEEQLPRIC